jgi:hypothetical protein
VLLAADHPHATVETLVAELLVGPCIAKLWQPA